MPGSTVRRDSTGYKGRGDSALAETKSDNVHSGKLCGVREMIGRGSWLGSLAGKKSALFSRDLREPQTMALLLNLQGGQCNAPALVPG
jgi:hypothetical protein